MREALPALRALGLFDVLAPRGARLQAFVDGQRADGSTIIRG